MAALCHDAGWPPTPSDEEPACVPLRGRYTLATGGVVAAGEDRYARGACQALADFQRNGVTWSEPESWRDDAFVTYHLWTAVIGYSHAAAAADPDFDLAEGSGRAPASPDLSRLGDPSASAAGGGADPSAGAGPRRSWWPLLLAAVGEVAVGVAGGVGGAALAGSVGAGGSDAERFARGACQALADWELTEAEFVVVDGEVPPADGWIAASGYGMAAGLTDDEFHEFEQAGRHILGALHRYDQDRLAEATERLADACADHGF